MLVRSEEVTYWDELASSSALSFLKLIFTTSQITVMLQTVVKSAKTMKMMLIEDDFLPWLQSDEWVFVWSICYSGTALVSYFFSVYNISAFLERQKSS